MEFLFVVFFEDVDMSLMVCSFYFDSKCVCNDCIKDELGVMLKYFDFKLVLYVMFEEEIKQVLFCEKYLNFKVVLCVFVVNLCDIQSIQNFGFDLFSIYCCDFIYVVWVGLIDKDIWQYYRVIFQVVVKDVFFG